MTPIEVVVAAAAAGLLSSPHCLAMCGPLAAAGCSRAGESRRSSTLGYFGGRVVSYATIGAVMGYLGQRALALLPVSAAQHVVVVTIAAFCVWRGVAALRRPTRLVALGRKRTGLSLTLTAVANTVGALLPKRGLGLGLATGLLPCGALVAGWTLAASTARADLGALAMAVFCIASLPGLVSALIGGHMLRQRLGYLPARAIALAWFGVAMLVIGRLLLTDPSACH